MSTLKIDDALLKGLYKTASDTDKSMLEEKFGKELFTSNVMDRIKTWEDAAAEKGLDPVKDLPYPKATTNRQKAVNAFYMCDVITEVLLDGVVLDWTNKKQEKWSFWLNNYKPGSGFSVHGADCDWPNSGASGGARLYLDTQEKAIYFATQFLPIINQFSNPIK